MSDDEFEMAGEDNAVVEDDPVALEDEEDELMDEATDAAGTDDESGEGEPDELEPRAADGPPAAPRADGPPRDPILALSNTSQVSHAVPDDERISSHQVSQSEFAALVAMRAAQIASSGTIFASAAGALTDPAAIATRELYERRCPLMITREMGAVNGVMHYETWDPKLMSFAIVPTL